MAPQALYTSSNCSAAYQLNWSLSVFGEVPFPPYALNLENLNAALAKDQVKLLESHVRADNVVQFFLSSRPETRPSEIVRVVKGRWAYLSRSTQPIQLRRNYRITSVGSAKNDVVDAYVSRQPQRHAMVDPRVQKMIESLQYRDESLVLPVPRRNHYGESIVAYHLVVETEGNWHDVREAALTGYRNAVVAVGRKQNWPVARIGLVCNHMHILLGAGVGEAPAEIALSILNNLAYTQEMKAIFKFSYYIGTFGKYDLGAIWNHTDHGREKGSR
jgi:REP element-mobilizing transposase RayT